MNKTLIKVSTLSQYIDIIRDTQTQINTEAKCELYFFYRGQRNNHKPLPGIYRNNLINKEDVLYHELILRCPEVFRGLTHLDTLVTMQHYGLPTRLLDVTSNPLVALYFACQDYGKGNTKPGKVFVYGVPRENLVYSDSDKALMLSCLPVFSASDRRKIQAEIRDSLASGEFKKTTRGQYYASIERLFHEIAKEVPAFKREIKPVDLATPIFVKPLRANARILKQDGAFIISGLCESVEEAEEKIHQLCSSEIEINMTQNIIKELDSVDINEASLFPEVEKVAEYLKQKCLS